ncbi:choline/carnitine/betaine transport [Agrococcus baldri]|uniref:Choline/carnitine/betaine transport n=1 Tax=Agrococcus baldri TaxID=153730 RepID=A0AA94KZI2_9MICO|nr:BCCT family transporter [Agrococcus baldri]SFS10375.1 choline/carnitine/betaine transport [Agrococcus baldri]
MSEPTHEPPQPDPVDPGPDDSARLRPMHPALDTPPLRAEEGGRRPLDRVVFGVAAAVALGFVLWGALGTQSLSTASGIGLEWVVHNTGWLFALAASGFVIFIVWIAASRYGRIPLGDDGATPEFSTVSWIAMMFSAGMGIGLVFYGVTEPVSHLVAPPPGTGGGTDTQAVRTAMATTMFHWSLHPWAIYSVVGLALAYSVFRKRRSLLISSAFTALVGKRVVEGPMGRAIDIFAIFATLFGSATSLGIGALQIGSGLQIVAGLDEVTNGMLIGVIAVLTAGFVVSAVSGVSRGIKWLSNTNMVLAGLLALFVFVVGPTIFILNLLPTTIAGYFEQIAVMSSRTEAAGGDVVADWLSGWTIFYWAWWISWTPFVGMFIARISRGRTVRQFVTGVLVAPTLVSLVWFAIFGGLGIDLSLQGIDLGTDGAEEAVLFRALAELPLGQITSVVVMVLVAIFFVSGADAASIVMGTLSHRGSLRPHRGTVVLWGVTTGAVAAVMLLLGGEDALDGLQQITIIAALPFVVVMVGLAFALARDLSQDPVVVRRKYALAAVEHAVVAGVTEHGDDFQLTIEQSPPGEGVGELVPTLPIEELPEHERHEAALPDDGALERHGQGADASADGGDDGDDGASTGGQRPQPAP